MLNVSSRQMETLAEVPQRSFAEELVDHLKDFAPRLFELRGEACMREMVRTGMRTAFDHGFSQRGPVRLWIELMCCFGHRFQNDPALPWAETLQQHADLHQQERARLMYEAMEDHAQRCDGENKSHLIGSLGLLAAADWDRLLANPPALSEVTASKALGNIFPHKCAQVGAERLQTLVREAVTVCEAHALQDDPAARFLMSGLMLGFGHGVADDPLYPWVADTLAARESTGGDADASRRTKALARKARAYVQATYEHLSH